MINTLYLPELREMLELSDVDGLREFCTALHPARTAEFMEGLTATEAWSVLQAADPATRVEIFGYLDREKQIEVFETCDPESVSTLIADMPADDRVDLLNAVDEEVARNLLSLVPADKRRDIQRLQAYPEGTAGAVMTTEVARLPESLTVREALQELSRIAENLETIYYIYIVDENNHLRGAVSARRLVTHLNKPKMPITELMERNLVTVEATDDQEAVAAKVADYDFLAIPVVDHEQHLVGIITHDDVIDVLQREATEDAYLAGAVGPLEEGYLSIPWFEFTRHRAPWLAILFGGAIITILALKSYHETIDKVAWLVLFLPLIVSCGGNSGSQSATLIIRALTTKEITPASWWAVVWRELLIGLALGLFLGAIGYAIGCFVAPSFAAALIIPITLILVVTCGTMVGSLLPLLFARLGWDPALMSAPFVTVIVDILGIVVYMNVALLMLRELS
ncbi:MAG: magnesium transporter [Planctomycetes bacterium]|nr:magnesium transporter [Planctomycetota bacterium]